MIPPVLAAEIAAKGKQTASKAITGDVYIRRWTTTRTTGKGKKKRTITTEHEAHVNPLSIAIGAAVTAATVGGALWLAQMRAAPVMVIGAVTDKAVVTRTQTARAAWTTPGIPAVFRNVEVKTWVANENADLPNYYGPKGEYVSSWKSVLVSNAVPEVHHPAVPDIWTVTRLGMTFKGATSNEAVDKAYPRMAWMHTLNNNAGTVTYWNTKDKKKLSIESREGFSADGLMKSLTPNIGRANEPIGVADLSGLGLLARLFGK